MVGVRNNMKDLVELAGPFDGETIGFLLGRFYTSDSPMMKRSLPMMVPPVKRLMRLARMSLFCGTLYHLKYRLFGIT